MTHITITLWGSYIEIETMTRELRAVLVVIRELDRMREGLWERALWVKR